MSASDRSEIDNRMYRADQARIRPLDTSQLGPIKVDAQADAAIARLVREALIEAARTVADEHEIDALFYLAEHGGNPTLVKLRGLLK